MREDKDQREHGFPSNEDESAGGHAERRLKIGFHETTSDGRVSLEPIYCFGNCACAPAVMIDGELHGRVSPEKFDTLLAAMGQAK